MVDTNNSVWAASTPGKRQDPADVRRQTFQYAGGSTGLIAAAGGSVGLTPGTPMSVRLDPCSVVAKSEYPGRGDEAYSFTVKSPVDVAIRPTGSGGGRTDVVAWVVSDPIFEGQEIAETDAKGNVLPGATGLDPNEYDYWRPHVFENVPSASARTTDSFRDWVRNNSLTLGTAVPYAKVTQGADSVGLEGKVTPFFDTVLSRKDSVIAEQEITRSYSETGEFRAYRTIGPSIYFDTPWWATRARVKATMQGVSIYRAGGGNRNGLVSGLALGQSMRQYSYYETSNSAYTRENFTIWADLAIPAHRRGNTQDFRFRATVNQDGARIQLGQGSHMFLEVDFLEDPNAVDNSDPGVD